VEQEKKMSLRDIDAAIAQITENGFAYDEETGELTFTSDDLDKLQEDVDKKINSIIGIIKDLQLEAELKTAQGKVSAEIYAKLIEDEYTKPASRASKKAEFLIQYLANHMRLHNLSEIKKTNGVAKYTHSTVCTIEDEDKIKEWLSKHPEYKDTFIKTEEKISKNNIKKYLKENEENTVDGASLVDKQTLKVK